ncbi:MAG: adenine deaminase [Desulfohalobiaceae bacterium]|nr:adenine deaminase [Desulfohalobiaceae bacterium]
MSIENRSKAARGELEADLLVRNCRLVNVLSGTIHQADVAIYDGIFLGCGDYRAREVLEAENRYLCPGFIDGHIHIESSLLSPVEFARIAARHGTAAVICDPHEICNVLGAKGLRYVLSVTEDLPLTVYCLLPSCVPATSLETAGGRLDAEDLRRLFLKYPERIPGLAEMMNVPGVLSLDPGVLAKLDLFQDRVIDGHCPGLSGKDLNAYILAGPGSEHEAVSAAEALEKLEKGMHLMIREGSSAQNLLDLLPVINDLNSGNVSLVTDDRHPDDFLDKGHLDHTLRLAIAAGLDPVRAVQMVSINTARYFGLKGIGAVAPGYRADFILLNDLSSVDIEAVYLKGKKVRDQDFAEFDHLLPESMVNLGEVSGRTFCIDSPGQGAAARALELIPGQILTGSRTVIPGYAQGLALADPEQDLAKLAVLERHQGTGNVGLGFVVGLGLQTGAIGSTVVHDSHNLILAGMNDSDMTVAAGAIQDMGGGFVVVEGEKVVASLPLPIAGLMSPWGIEDVVRRLNELNEAAERLGCPGDINPFMLLSFLALPVIPKLRLTDKGLVDVEKFAFVPLWLAPGEQT